MTAKSKSPHNRGRSRGSLSEGEILAGAIAVAGRDGLDGLSMPNLAKHLGASAMSLYRYFHSKDDLLAAMADRTINEVFSRLPPVSEGSWDDEVVRLMSAVRGEMKRTPLFAELFRAKPMYLFSQLGVTPAFARRLNDELQVLHKAGFTLAEALRMHNVLFAFTLGFGLLELGAQSGNAGSPPEKALELSVAQLDADEFPTLRAVEDVGALISVRETDYDAFLRLLVAGLQSDLGAE